MDKYRQNAGRDVPLRRVPDESLYRAPDEPLRPAFPDIQNFHNRFSAPARGQLSDSMVRRKEKFLGTRLREYRPAMSCPWWPVPLLLLAVYLFYAFGSSAPPVHFCDTFDSLQLDCEPCPVQATCADGKVKHCAINFVFNGRECVKNEEISILAFQIAEEVERRLARQNGDFECAGEDRTAAMKISEIEAAMVPAFGRKTHFEPAVLSLQSSLLGDRISFLKRHTDERKGTFITAERVDFSFFCSIYMFYRRNRFWLFLIAALSLYVLYKVLVAVNDSKYYSRAEAFYKEVLAKLRREEVGSVNIKNLIAGDVGEFSTVEREKIMKFMDKIRKRDEQLGVFHEAGETYWVPL